MKVHELIAELQKQDQEAEVLVDGYEMGVSDVTQVISGIAYKNVDRPFYIGRYELNEKGEYTPEDAVPIKAVYLPRLDHVEEWEGDVWEKVRANGGFFRSNKE